MKCPKCQAENREAAKFCDECGHQLSATSTSVTQSLSFDEKIDKIQRYLPKGLTEKILSQRGKIEGERKQVTVMFCDMEGFTPLVEKLGSERAYTVMDEIYEILIHKIHDYEGTVNEMTGDGIMALFGAPIALEDAPQRALLSALAIHHEIENFNGNRKGIEPIKMRIGVHTGPVVVGTLGNDLRVEFKAVGDTVNLASRMEGIAEPGTTCVTEDTFKFTEGLFNFEALGEREIKGKEGTLPVYKLLSGKGDAHRPRVGFERSIYSEMVGRDKELDRLELQVMKAINGEGSIVNIIGEAGIGKSRLVAELKNREVIKRVSMFEGRAISTGRNLSFYPIIALLRQWARIGENDSGATAVSKLETAIRRIAAEDLDEILPFVATLMGMKLSGRYAERVKEIEGEALEKLILKNMRDLLFQITEQSPLVIVIEDFHWADTSSIELMESLFRLAETQRIVFINVFRPDHKETGDRIVVTINERYAPQYIQINLQPLDERMSEILINNMLQIKGLRHSVIDQIVERADGNPFFIEEVVRSFIDQGAVVQKDGVFEVTAKIDSIVIPNTINDVLMARIDRLDEKTRELVKIASVIGRSFFYRILKEMTKTIEDVDSKLSHLQEIQLIRERKRMEEIEYLFKHALAQEAAYESILSEMRKELHLKVAESIERVFKERLLEFYGMLAYHYSKGENLDKAEEYMIKAGEEALSSSASSEALSYYQNALNIILMKYGETVESEKIALLEKNISLAYYNNGNYPEALIYFDSVLKRWGITPVQNKGLLLLKFLFNMLSVVLNLYLPFKKAGKNPNERDIEIFYLNYKKCTTLVLSDTKRMVVEQLGDMRRLFKYNFKEIPNWYNIFGEGVMGFLWSGISFSLSKKIIDFMTQFIDIKNPIELFSLQSWRGFYNFFSDEWNALDVPDNYLIEENLKAGNCTDVASHIFFFALFKIYRGEFDVINKIIERLEKVADDFDNKVVRQFQLYTEVFISLQQGRLNQVQKLIGQYERLFKSEFDVQTVCFLGWKAEARLLLKDYESVEKTFDRIEWIYKKGLIVPPTIASIYLYPKALYEIILLEHSAYSENKSNVFGLKKRASKCCKNLMQNAKKSPRIRTRSFRLLGLYNWLINKQNEAVKYWKLSIGAGKRLGQRPDLARTYMEIGKRFMETKSRYKELNGISAVEYLEKARELFLEMDLQWDLDELDNIVVSS